MKQPQQWRGCISELFRLHNLVVDFLRKKTFLTSFKTDFVLFVCKKYKFFQSFCPKNGVIRISKHILLCFYAIFNITGKFH